MIVHLFMNPDYDDCLSWTGIEFNEIWTEPEPLGEEDEYVESLDLDDLTIPEIHSLQDKLQSIGNVLAVQILIDYLQSLGV